MGDYFDLLEGVIDRNKLTHFRSITWMNRAYLWSRSDAATAPPNQMREVFRTNPDDKCFFRSVAISLNRKLQVNRDSYGTLPNPILMLQETSQADSLCSRMVEFCLQNHDVLSEQMKDDVLNADMPAHIHYSSLLDRLGAMMNPCNMVGEFEINKTAEMLKKTTSKLLYKMGVMFFLTVMSLMTHILFSFSTLHLGRIQVIMTVFCRGNLAIFLMSHFPPSLVSSYPPFHQKRERKAELTS